jgi:hypothetical protein
MRYSRYGRIRPLPLIRFRAHASRRKKRGASTTRPASFPQPTPYWQVVLKLSGNATSVTPRTVAPTRTS